MGAPVASGTLAGSTSGSWASIQKQAPGGDFSRFRRHPRVVRLAQPSRPSRSRTSSSGTIPATARSSSSSSTSPAVRDSSVREARRHEPPVVCQQPPAVRSPQLGYRRRSRPRGRRDYRNRGVAIARAEPAREQKQSRRAQAAHDRIWAEALVRHVDDRARSGLSERRRCARPPWGRRGDRFRRMRSCRSPAPPAARGYRVGAGTVGLPGGSSGVSVASTSMLLARRSTLRQAGD